MLKNWCGFFCLMGIFLAGCGWFTNPIGTDDTSGQPAISDGDYPDITPCSDRDTLPSDPTFLSTITDATEVIHIHKEYISDLNLPAVCGLAAADNTLQEGEEGWDPLLGVDVYACDSFDESPSTFLDSTNYSPGICRTSFGYDKEDTDREGFPRGGDYRFDACINYEGKSYNVRLRANISGDDVDKTWASVGIDQATSLEIFNNDGLQLTTMEEAKTLVTKNPGGTVFTIRSGEGANTHLTIGLQLICVKSVASCPDPDSDNTCN